MLKRKFKDNTMQAVYELGLVCTYPCDLMAGKSGEAWNIGYERLKKRYPYGSVAFAAYTAGKEVKRREA